MVNDQLYLNHIQSNIKSDPSSLWSFLHLKNGTSRIPDQLRDNNGNIFSEPQDIVHAFATAFANVFTVNDSTSISSNSFSMSSVSIENLSLIISKNLCPS